MIKLIESPEEFVPCGESPFGCRVRSAATAYGVGKPFARFWKQEDRAFLVKLDDALVMEAGHETDFEEMSSFIRMLDVHTISCSLENAEKMGFSAGRKGEIMKGTSLPLDFSKESGTETNPPIREIYSLLCEAETEHFQPPQFEPFYMDLSYRTRHETALSQGIRKGDKLASCAVCTAMTPTAAVISAVAVSPDFRRQGLGGSALLSLAGLLNRPNLYIFRTQDENEAFYRSMGFTSCGQWAQITL